MGVQALLFLDQGVVGAGLHDAPHVHDDDPVGMAHGGQTVGNDEHGAALADVLHVALDDGLRLVVERAGGFVQDEDAGLVNRARAMAMRWRCPPERLPPCSPTRVS